MSATIGAFIDALGRTHSDRPALISAAQRVSYRELAAAANRVAKGLAHLGVSKGERVGILMPNRPQWLACAFGALKLGATIVPLNTLLRRPELEYALRYADVTVLITVSRFLNHAYIETLRQIVPALDASEGPLAATPLPALRHVI